MKVEQQSRNASPKEIHPTTDFRMGDAVKRRFGVRLEVVPDASQLFVVVPVHTALVQLAARDLRNPFVDLVLE